VLRPIRRVVEAIAKPVVLARSYSPASVLNSFLDDNGVVSIRAPQSYVQYICEICDMVGTTFLLPFAGQAVILREDSRWANDFRTTMQELGAGEGRGEVGDVRWQRHRRRHTPTPS
jgi:hypothetical protein